VDEGVPPGTAPVAIRRDGETLENRNVRVGQPVSVEMPITHAGQNIVEIEAAPIEGQLTAVHNRAVVPIDGVRDKLRVLLVSGEPNPGERTWRNLLKSDPSVDLVHFTILRPPEKQDGTPINIPRVVGVHSSDTYNGNDWIGLKIGEASVVRGIGLFPVFAGLIGQLLLVGSLAATWAREGR
jgi:hypothetical protein